MALNLYRRHGARCRGGPRLHQMTYEADELRRGWRKCSCPIYASGTLGGRFRRRNIEQNTWTSAKEVASEWQKAGYSEGQAKPVEPPIETAVATACGYQICRLERDANDAGRAAMHSWRKNDGSAKTEPCIGPTT